MNDPLETLNIHVHLQNITRDDQQDPTVTLSLNEHTTGESTLLAPGKNTLKLIAPVLKEGTQRLTLTVTETQRAWNTGAFMITDVKIHGVSVGGALGRCRYVPRYDDEFLSKNPDMPRQMDTVLHIGNRGTWTWRFEAPVYNNKSLNIGLW